MAREHNTRSTTEEKEASKGSEIVSVMTKKESEAFDRNPFAAIDKNTDLNKNPFIKVKDKETAVAANLWGEMAEEEEWIRGRLETRSMFLRSYD